jgi:hypothetical protein
MPLVWLRATAFNTPVIESSSTVDKHNAGHELVYNVDASGLLAVHKPTAVTSGDREVSHCQWRKGGRDLQQKVR